MERGVSWGEVRVIVLSDFDLLINIKSIRSYPRLRICGFDTVPDELLGCVVPDQINSDVFYYSSSPVT